MIKAPPPRLLEDAEVNASLRAQLEAAARAESGYDVSAGLARFDAGVANLGGGLQSTAAAPTSAASAGGLVVKLVTAAVGAALLISATWYLAGRAPSQSLRAPQVQRPSASPQLMAADHPAQILPSPAPEPVAPPAPIHKASEARAGKSVTQHSEVSRLLRARELLRSDPEAALVLLKQIERDNPRGVLREEREGLLVLALWNTGEHTRARLLAQRFLASYPSSALRERMRVLLDDAPEESP